MNRLVALSPRLHGQVRVDVDKVAALGARLNMVPVVLSEFAKLSLQYPVALTKNGETGQFVCVCLFGFAQHENLFWRGDRWDAIYTPLQVARQPFFLGSNSARATGTGEVDRQFVVCIDTESETLKENRGEAIFDEQGNETPYLKKMKAVLTELLDGEAPTESFVRKLLAMDLVQPMRLQIEFVNGQTQRIEGIYTVDERRMQSLPPQALLELHSLNYLAPIYTMIASLGHIYSLVNRKNAVLAG